MYRITENFHMVPIFALFAVGLATYKIRIAKVLMCVLCGFNTEKVQKLKPRKFLLEVILVKARKFAPANISHYSV